MILRLDRYRVEESMKFGTKNLVGVRNKSSPGATCFDDPEGEGGGEDRSFQFLISFISMKTRLINQTLAVMLLITKLNQNTSTACKLGCVAHLDSLKVFMSSENTFFPHVE